MKLSKLFFLSLFLTSATFLSAQQKVVLQSNGTATVFGGAQPFTDAYNAASETGDTIYLPGGSLVYPATIAKGLVIYGAGHYPDSTQATGKTVLNGNLAIAANSDNLHLEGIELTGVLNFATNVKIDNVVLRRCRFGGINYGGNASSPCENNQIIQCVINGSIYFSNAKVSTISNCFIGDAIVNGSEIAVLNNIFFRSVSQEDISNLKNSSVSNNIFLRRSNNNYQYYCTGVVFSNNIFKHAAPNISANNSDINNYKDVDIDTLLVNQSGQAFDYSHDYHLLSPAAYPGTDGTQVGVYGGLFPYKAAAVPVNPHISSKFIAPQTNNEGELQIEINVNAQDE
ncbi:hypothetical protein LJC53_03510 [Bacteroidales bacterium OttesenSCG-928-C03]|nr:hypothetical protein [Bacteroidales bacterium OttesenSCG-928-C03]